MKRTIYLFLSLFLLITGSLSAQKAAEVELRFSTKVGLIRIVLEGNETFILKSKVTPSDLKIKIVFPKPFKLIPQKEPPFGITLKDNTLIINLKEESVTKFFRLSSPPRLVIDIKEKVLQSDKQTLTILSDSFVIDAGHGGYDFGLISGKESEKEVCLNLARSLGRALSKKGKRVFYTRKVDQYVSLADRISLVSKKRPDIFISFHTSVSENFVLYSPKFEDQNSETIVDYYSLFSQQRRFLEKSKALTDSMEKAIEEEFNVEVIRREMHLPILNSANAPCVLIEIPSPKFLVYDKQIKDRIKNAILSGIAAYGLKQIQMDIIQ